MEQGRVWGFGLGLVPGILLWVDHVLTAILYYPIMRYGDVPTIRVGIFSVVDYKVG